ncbi:hypothetical protein EXIGLDRAFT_783115 [Exidia glandulosa HHB12029]|uniref:Uncharacterized protein n=1 Tax=Exidia glandulosa HHB12029 TaxID=1314781 RepID=A0A165Z2W6_EXIGL|nr:hypothetical protein EXIGLDRAFT_783115 [Exidia glandulosa HHB12029]
MLHNALAGVFCASLDPLDEDYNTKLVVCVVGTTTSWQERAVIRDLTSLACLHRKADPLRQAPAVLATLLNPHALFSAPLHGLSVQYTQGLLNILSFGTDDPPSHRHAHFAQFVTSSFLFLRHTMSGGAQYAAGLPLQLVNAHNETVRVSYLETLSWSVALYLPLLDIRADEHPRQRLELLERLSYIPPRAPAPATLEPVLRLSPILKVMMRFLLEQLRSRKSS